MNDPDENPWSDAPPTGAQNSWPAKRQTPPDLGSLSLAPSAHQQSPQQSDIWNLDQADWATQPSTNAQAVGASTFASSNQTSSAPQSSTEVSVQTQTEPTEMLQTPQRESKPQPPTTTTVPENFSTPKHIPSLSLSSLKNVFTAAQSGSLGTPPILTPASVNAEAGPSSATKDTFSTTPSAANLDGNTGQLQSVPNTPTKTSDPPFDFKRFQQQMASVWSWDCLSNIVFANDCFRERLLLWQKMREGQSSPET